MSELFGTYVGIRVSLKTQAALKEWMDESHIPPVQQLPANHVTIVFSKIPIVVPPSDPVEFKTMPEVHSLDLFNSIPATYGSEKLLVVKFESPYLSMRFASLIAAGANTDFPSYSPHISIAKVSRIPEDLKPPTFPLELVEEYEAIRDFRVVPPKFYTVNVNSGLHVYR